MAETAITEVKLPMETNLQRHSVFPVMGQLVEGHVFHYGKLMKHGLKPALAKSMMADQILDTTNCCPGGDAKLTCGAHYLAWAYVTSIEALWDAASK